MFSTAAFAIGIALEGSLLLIGSLDQLKVDRLYAGSFHGMAWIFNFFILHGCTSSWSTYFLHLLHLYPSYLNLVMNSNDESVVNIHNINNFIRFDFIG